MNTPCPEEISQLLFTITSKVVRKSSSSLAS